MIAKAIAEMTARVIQTTFLLGFLISINAAGNSTLDSATCPLDLHDVPAPPQACFSTVADNYTTAQCCYTIYVNLAGALAINTNVTGGELFLNASQEAACAQIANNNHIATSYCSVAPPVFTANEGPCLFATESQLEANLSSNSISGPNYLGTLSATCASVEQQNGCAACHQLFDNAVGILVGKIGDNSSLINCRAALLVSLASHNVSEEEWRYALYSCLNLPYTQPVTDKMHHGMQMRNIMIALGVCIVVSVVAFLVVVVFFLYFSTARRRHHVQSDDDYKDDSRTDKGAPVNEGILYEFSPKELMKATEGFSEKNFIGEGSAGKVYKGTLPSGQLVAVKVILNEKKLETFYKEIENLSRVRHPNLVTLIGFCQTADMNLLVYEYCARGNLWYYLFGDGPSLTWDQRINIALGSARGIVHLHMNPGGYIVHRDIKPTNILLTESYEAKVSDFGLSRFIAIDESCVFTEVKGTAGYLDPEYLNNGTLTFSSDVYSFGVVLLQLVSGRRPIDLDPVKRLSLSKMARLVVARGAELSEMVDPRLNGVYAELTFRKMVEIAVQCTSENSISRPTMIEVRQYLEEAWSLASDPATHPPTTASELSSHSTVRF